MQAEEQQLIDGLFTRLKDAERQTGSRDVQAESYIQQRLREQPAAPYYLAQVVLIQESALKRLEQQVKDLEAKVSQLQEQAVSAASNKPSTGGFLSGLFGGSNTASSAPPVVPAATSNRGWVDPGPRYNTQASTPAQTAWQQPAPAAPARTGGGFLAGAAQTAAGVAGGMLLAETLSGFFHGDKSESSVAAAPVTPPASEPAPSFVEPPQPTQEYVQADDTFNDGDSFFDDGDDDSFV